ncbi:MAG: hypothetical protein JXR65_07840 [Bacteroidales bacterium]|nr:hypothetical protein [Bacteroidales bacterium]
MKTNKIAPITLILFIALLPMAVHAQEDAWKYDKMIFKPNPYANLEQAKQVISRVLNDKCVTVSDSVSSGWVKLKVKKVLVFDDRIEIYAKRGTHIVYFSKLFGDSPIELEVTYGLYYSKKTGQQHHDSYHDFILGTHGTHFWKHKEGFGVTMRNKSDYPTCNREMTRALYTIQNQFITLRYAAQLEAFKAKAEKYLTAKVKPIMSEEQRKYVVQANLQVKQKKYAVAIGLYQKVIDIDAVTYPEAYNNLALLYGQLSNYKAAIFYMRKYLLLKPGEKDARAAQDKIYEWEFYTKTGQ